MANRTRLRRSASADRPCAPHHAAAIRSAQKRILSNAGPLFQSGKEDFEHRDFLQHCGLPAAEQSDAVPRRAAGKKEADEKQENGYADSKSFHAVQRDGPRPARTGGAATRTRPPPGAPAPSQPRAAIR